MWNIFNKRNKELRFKILQIQTKKQLITNKYITNIKVKCLNDNLVFDIFNFYDKDLKETENKILLKSILIKEYNKILKEKEYELKKIHKGNII